MPKKNIICILLLAVVFAGVRLEQVWSVQKESAKQELVISDFETQDVLWKGGEISDEKAKEGKYSLKWENLPSNPVLKCDSVPSDWTNYDVLSFWFYSEVANNQGFQLVIFSENPESEGIDYYAATIKVDWTGWKKFSFSLSSLGIARKPRGWDQIDYIYFSSNGWNHTPLQDTVLYLDEVKLEKTGLLSASLINNWNFEEFNQEKKLPEGWGLALMSGEVLVSSDDKIFFDGNKSVKMESTGDTSRAAIGSNTILVKPGEVYSFSVWHKTKGIKSAQYGVVARFHFFDSNKKPLADVKKHLLYLEGRQGTHDWMQIKGIFKVPESSAYASVGLFIWLTTGSVWWDKVELFKVPDDTKLTVFFEEEPKKVLMKTLPEIKHDTTKISTHPRLFFSKDDIPKLKEKLKHPLIKPLWEDIIKTADNLLVSPVVKLPISVEETLEAIKANKVWGNYLLTARRAIDFMTTLSFAYVMTGDNRYAEKAKEQIFSILEWESWVDPCHFPRKADLMTGELLFGIGTVYDWIFDRLTDIEKEKIRRTSIERGLAPYYTSVGEKVGWSIYQNNWMGVVNGGAGVGVLAFLGEEQESSDWIDIARDILCNRFLNMEEGIRSAGDKDGGWNEGVGYWNYGMSYFSYFADALKNVTAGKTNLFEEPFLKNTVYFPIYMTMPDNTGYVNFSDSPYGAPAGVVPVMSKFASEHKNPHAQWFVDKFKKGYDKIFSLLWYDPDVPSKVPRDLPPAKLFSGINWAVLRSDWENPDGILFALKGGTLKDPHGHLDMNHFILNANSERMIIDLGAGAYSKDYWGKQSYQVGTRGHNTILIDGEGQVNSKGARGEINKFFHSEDFDYVVGDASSAYPMLEKFFRNVIYVRQGYFIINDELESKYEVNFSWLLHTFSDITSFDERRFLFSGRKGNLLVDMLIPAKFQYKIESTKDDKFLEVFTENKCEKLNFTSLLIPFKFAGAEKQQKNKNERIRALLIMKKEASEYEIILSCLKKSCMGVDYINEDKIALFDKSAEELLKDYDIIFLANLPTGGAKYLSENQMKTISEYVKNGGGLFIPGGLDSFGDGNFIGTPIEEILPVRITSKDDLVKNVVYSPIVVDRSHPVLAGIPDKWPQFGSPAGGYQKLELRPDARILMRVPVSDTTIIPFLAIREYGKGRTMIFNSTWAWGTGGNFKKWEYAPDFLGRCAYWLSRKNYLMLASMDMPKEILPDKEYNITVRVKNMSSENLTKVTGKIVVPSYVTIIPSSLDFGEIGSYGSKEILCKIKSSETKGNFDVKIDCQTKEGEKDSMEISKTFDFPLPSVKYLFRGKDILGLEYTTDSYTDIVLMEKEGSKNFGCEGKIGVFRENKKKSEKKVLIVEGKKIILKGEELFNSNVPVIASLSINDSGVKGAIKTDSIAVVQIRVDFKPGKVMLNGNSVKYIYDNKRIEIKLPAGDNTLDILQ